MIKAYDDLGRVITRTTTLAGADRPSTYTYVAGGHGTGSTTGLISAISQYGQNWAYTYDDVGNITSEVHGGYTISYGYDSLGQLTRVNDERAGDTWTFDYDRGGNILSKSRYAYTTGTLGTALETVAYTYDAVWKDKLASYNGIPVTYDAIGNPLTFDWNYTWQCGRQLAMVEASGNWASFEYNADGLRIRKNLGSIPIHYTLHGKHIVHLSQLSDHLHFFHDAQGRPSIVDFNGTRYGYIHNLQGDIVAIIDGSGTPVVEYTYDTWGKPLSKTGSMANTLGALNPFRYRGYVYDEETGLYYLRSRYYNPEWGRFLNADSVLGKPGQLLGHNVYLYCNNNPLNMSDASGNIPSFNTMETDSGYDLLTRSPVGLDSVINPDTWQDHYEIGNVNYAAKAVGFIILLPFALAAGSILFLCIAEAGVVGGVVGTMVALPMAFTGSLIGDTFTEDMQNDGVINGNTTKDANQKILLKNLIKSPTVFMKQYSYSFGVGVFLDQLVDDLTVK